MKVALVTGEFPPMVGGVGDYTACLAGALHSLGLQVCVLTSAGAQPPEGAFPFPVLSRVQAWSFSSWGLVRREVQRLGADIAHIQYQSAAYGLHPAINLLPLSLRLRAPDVRSVVTFHDLRVPYVFPKAGPLRPWAVQALACWCHGVICTDDADYRTVSGWGLKGPLYLIPIGSNIMVAEQDRWPEMGQGNEAGQRAETGQSAATGNRATTETGQRAGPPGGTSPTGPGHPRRGAPTGGVVTIGYFGLLNQSKGVETLLRAYRLVLQRGKPMTLVMIGADLGDSDASNAACARMLRALAAELDLERAIRWTGHLSNEETSLALRLVDVCILPYLDGASFRRGTLMAALAHGLPIITTTPDPAPVAGPRLEDGGNCRLVPSGDVGALAQAMEELAGAPHLRERLAAGALELARSFTWEEIARKTVAVYGEVLSRGKRS